MPHRVEMWQGRPRPCRDTYEYAERSARAAVYEVVAKGPAGFSKTLGMANPNDRFPQTDARSGEAVKFRVACSRLPEKDLSFSVTAISCWGRRSVPLTLQAKF